MQALYTSTYIRARSSEALDAPGWFGAGVLPGETPASMERTEYPATLDASCSQSAESEYALGEFMTDTLKATTTQNARSLRATDKLIIGSPNALAGRLSLDARVIDNSGRWLVPRRFRASRVYHCAGTVNSDPRRVVDDRRPSVSPWRLGGLAPAMLADRVYRSLWAHDLFDRAA